MDRGQGIQMNKRDVKRGHSLVVRDISLEKNRTITMKRLAGVVYIILKKALDKIDVFKSFQNDFFSLYIYDVLISLAEAILEVEKESKENAEINIYSCVLISILFRDKGNSILDKTYTVRNKKAKDVDGYNSIQEAKKDVEKRRATSQVDFMSKNIRKEEKE